MKGASPRALSAHPGGRDHEHPVAVAVQLGEFAKDFPTMSKAGNQDDIAPASERNARPSAVGFPIRGGRNYAAEGTYRAPVRIAANRLYSAIM